MVFKKKSDDVFSNKEIDDAILNKIELSQNTKEFKITKDNVVEIQKPRILAIAAKNRKGKVMLHELQARKDLDVVTMVEADLEEDVIKNVQNIVKDEAKAGNSYHVAYVSISNTDFNKNPEYAKLRDRNLIGLPVNLYFDGHEDSEISKKAAAYKID